MKSKLSNTEKIIMAVGMFLLASGIILNESMITKVLCKGIVLEPAGRVSVLSFEVIAVAAGLLLIFGRGKAPRYYQECAIAVSTTIIFLIVANFVMFLSIAAKDSAAKTTNPIFKKYGIDSVMRAYPTLDRSEVSRLLDETWSRRLMYDPFKQFREAPYSGRYVNVDENGFRLTKDQGPWPPDKEKYFTVFVFGGSTCFGYGVADADTIASYLQEHLSAVDAGKEIKVYNFGCGCYYSAQERILFEQLIAKGFIPNAAIFIDGYNESFGASEEPEYTRNLRLFMKGDWGLNLWLMSERLPIVRAAGSLGNMISRRFHKGKDRYYNRTEQVAAIDRPLVQKSIQQYVQNKRIIEAVSSSYKIKPIFVWQPVVTYKYDLKNNPFWNESYEDPFIRSGYPEMEKYVREHPMGENFLWCADMQEGDNELLYVDKFHYSADMSKKVAKVIADMIKERGLL